MLPFWNIEHFGQLPRLVCMYSNVNGVTRLNLLPLSAFSSVSSSSSWYTTVPICLLACVATIESLISGYIYNENSFEISTHLTWSLLPTFIKGAMKGELDAFFFFWSNTLYVVSFLAFFAAQPLRTIDTISVNNPSPMCCISSPTWSLASTEQMRHFHLNASTHWVWSYASNCWVNSILKKKTSSG